MGQCKGRGRVEGGGNLYWWRSGQSRERQMIRERERWDVCEELHARSAK